MDRLPRIVTLALFALVGTLLVFFFPAHVGSFTVTHGPATAFRALAAAERLFAAISAAILVAAALVTLRLQLAMAPAAPLSCATQTLQALRC